MRWGKFELKLMNIRARWDHHVVDGREAVTFLGRVKECVEDPARLVPDLQVLAMVSRPILVWVIFTASIAVVFYAAWSLFNRLRTGAVSISDYGFTGLFVSMIPVTVLLAAGLSLFALTRWAILAAGLNLLVVLSFFLVESALAVTIVWLVLSLGMFVYAIWLWRIGTLT